MHSNPSPTLKVARHRNRKSDSNSLPFMKPTSVCSISSFIKCIVFLIGISAGYLHWLHVSFLHENDLFFSHLSSIEREMTFGTEMGFYYSYYKQIITASNLSEGWQSLLADSRSEHPPCIQLNSNRPKPITNCQTINAMQRFNLYPELLLATVFRFALKWNLFQRDCYQVNRELPTEPIAIAADPKLFQNPDPSSYLVCNQSLMVTDKSVLSCVGSGEPIYFYVNSVFLLSGLILVGLSLSGWIIASLGCSTSNSSSSCCNPAYLSTKELGLALWGSVLPVAAYFFNHREATRIQWTPPLRESFAYPFFILQQTYLIWFIHVQLKDNKNSSTHLFITNTIYCLLLLGFQLPWQFAQFALATQIASLFGTCCCLLIALNRLPNPDLDKLAVRLINLVKHLVCIHLIGLVLTWILQFGNTMLLTTGYPAGLIGTLLGLRILKKLVQHKFDRYNGLETDSRIIHNRFMRFLIVPTFCTLISTLILNSLIKLMIRLIGHSHEDQDDGGHIWDMLMFKFLPFGQYRNFHTMLYTCAPEFDFIGWTSLSQPMKTGLLVNSALVCAIVLWSSFLKPYFTHHSSPTKKSSKFPVQENHSPSLAQSVPYHFISLFIVIQLLFFTIMATLIMRLKLFWTPHMCLTLSIMAQPVRLKQIFNCIIQIPRSFQSYPTSQIPDSKPKLSPVRSNLASHLILTLVLAHMTYYGIENLQAEWKIQGSFVGYHQEVLVQWLRSLPARTSSPLSNSSYPRAWILSGPLSVMGSLRLLLPAPAPYPTPQPILDGQPGFGFTNHPHYENVELRQRTILASSIYSRHSAEDVWHVYRDQLKTDFVLVEAHDCPPRQGCSKPELFDLIEPGLATRSALCELLMSVDVTYHGQTPNQLMPYFRVVYTEPSTGRVILYVNKQELRT